MVSNIEGNDLELAVQGIPIGCADTIDLTLTTASTSAVCRDSGGWGQSVPGQHTWGASTGGLIRLATGVDAANNVTYTNLRKLQVDRTRVELKFGTDISGDEVATGFAYITETKATSPANGAATFTVSFVGDGPLTFTTNP